MCVIHAYWEVPEGGQKHFASPKASYKNLQSTTQGPFSSPLSGTFAQVLGPGREFYKEVEIPCTSPNFLLYWGRLEIAF